MDKGIEGLMIRMLRSNRKYRSGPMSSIRSLKTPKIASLIRAYF